MTLKEQLLEAGYKQFNSSLDADYVLANYQKCYRDELGKKYFINVKEYKPMPQLTQPNGFEYSFDMQIETRDGNINIQTVQWFFSDNKYHPVKNLANVEQLFELIWVATGRIYYEEGE